MFLNRSCHNRSLKSKPNWTLISLVMMSCLAPMAYSEEPEEAASSKSATVVSDSAQSNSESINTTGPEDNLTELEVFQAPLNEEEKRLLDVMEFLADEGQIDPEVLENYRNKLNASANERYTSEQERQKKLTADQKAEEEFDGVRITHVPQFVRNQIRDQVRFGVQEDVVNAVMSQAKTQAWGVPNAWPSWLKKIKLYSDFRFRAEHTAYGEDNEEFKYVNFDRINDRRSFVAADEDLDDFLNVTEDRTRYRVRARIGFKTKISEFLSTDFRLATGNTGNPISTNQTLGDEFNKYSVVMDRAAFVWKDADLDGYPWLDVMAGRIKNPFFKTDLIWDSDINLDGFAFTYRHNLSGGDDLFSQDQRDKTLFFTAGAFPIDEVEISGRDKWLYAAQLGSEFILEDQTKLTFAVAYYSFDNVVGRVNEFNTNLNDFTAPEFVSKGNTVINIAQETGDPNARLAAYASDYDLLNFTFRVDIARFAPERLILDLDYVENVGYSSDDVTSLQLDAFPDIGFDADAENTRGYQVKFLYGWPKISHYRDWNIQFAYRYLESDAVLASFTDSDFHGGGTDAQGWWFKTEYGIEENTSIGFKYISSSNIDLADLDVEIAQLDLTTRF